MSFQDYLDHYLSMPQLLLFIAATLLIVVLMHAALYGIACKRAKHCKPEDREFARKNMFKVFSEQYYELMFSATSTLLFTGIYFLIDFDYFHMSAGSWQLWMEYRDFILLGFLVMSIVLINLLDHFIIPLRKLIDYEVSALRLSGMIYMLIIFAYIKFIYEDNNYDMILFYFLTMLIGRFVYLDATFGSFRRSLSQFMIVLPILFVVLLSTALLALIGFTSGYLLRSNGVVVSLFLAHSLVIMEIFIIHHISRIVRKRKKALSQEAA